MNPARGDAVDAHRCQREDWARDGARGRIPVAERAFPAATAAPHGARAVEQQAVHVAGSHLHDRRRAFWQAHGGGALDGHAPLLAEAEVGDEALALLLERAVARR